MEDDKAGEEKKTLYCGNLDHRVTEELLYEVFLQAGPLESVKIPIIRGRPANFAFVEYVHACSAPYALKLYEGLKLFRKAVNIQYKADTSNAARAQRQQDYQQRHSLPSDGEQPSTSQQHSSPARESHDDGALRGSPSGSGRQQQMLSNPNKSNKEADGGGKERGAHSRSTHRSNRMPYRDQSSPKQ